MVIFVSVEDLLSEVFLIMRAVASQFGIGLNSAAQGQTVCFATRPSGSVFERGRKSEDGAPVQCVQVQQRVSGCLSWWKVGLVYERLALGSLGFLWEFLVFILLCSVLFQCNVWYVVRCNVCRGEPREAGERKRGKERGLNTYQTYFSLFLTPFNHS